MQKFRWTALVTNVIGVAGIAVTLLLPDASLLANQIVPLTKNLKLLSTAILLEQEHFFESLSKYATEQNDQYLQAELLNHEKYVELFTFPLQLAWWSALLFAIALAVLPWWRTDMIKQLVPVPCSLMAVSTLSTIGMIAVLGPEGVNDALHKEPLYFPGFIWPTLLMFASYGCAQLAWLVGAWRGDKIKDE
jgi:hypothetical protein